MLPLFSAGKRPAQRRHQSKVTRVAAIYFNWLNINLELPCCPSRRSPKSRLERRLPSGIYVTDTPKVDACPSDPHLSSGSPNMVCNAGLCSDHVSNNHSTAAIHLTLLNLLVSIFKTNSSKDSGTMALLVDNLPIIQHQASNCIPTSARDMGTLIYNFWQPWNKKYGFMGLR